MVSYLGFIEIHALTKISCCDPVFVKISHTMEANNNNATWRVNLLKSYAGVSKVPARLSLPNITIDSTIHGKILPAIHLYPGE